WYQTIQQHRFIPKLSSLFLQGAIVSLILSTFGPFLLGILAGNGLKDSVYFDMSIYFYLHFQYNGWLYFSLIGLFIWILYNKNILMVRTQKGYKSSKFHLNCVIIDVTNIFSEVGASICLNTVKRNIKNHYLI